MPDSVTQDIREGFVYVATGSGYVEEARLSAVSLKAHHPGHPVCLITDATDITAGREFDIVVACTNAQHAPIDKLFALRCPFERAIFVDTDTLVLGDLSPVFRLLDRFDLALHQDVNRGWDYQLPGVPEAFTEFNTGVIAFRRTAAVEAFFGRWRENHERLHRERGFVNDQPAFRQTLYESDLRVAPLPSEFHFLGNFPNYIAWKVRLIHARGDLPAMARDIDSLLGARAWVPGVGPMPSFHGRRSWLAATVATTLRMLKLLWRPPADSAQANPRKWWEHERRT